MKVTFAVVTSPKIKGPLHVYKVSDEVKVGDQLRGQTILHVFSHEERVANRYGSKERKSARGAQELALHLGIMEFSHTVTPGDTSSELERLLTAAFVAGHSFASNQNSRE